MVTSKMVSVFVTHVIMVMLVTWNVLETVPVLVDNVNALKVLKVRIFGGL